MNIDNIALSRGEKWRRTVLGIHVLFANSSASWRWTFCEHCDLPAGSMLGLINRGRWRDTARPSRGGGCPFWIFQFLSCLVWRPSGTHSPANPTTTLVDSFQLTTLICGPHPGKEYNHTDFSIDYLVMSMCKVFSHVVGRGCLL